MKLDKTGIWSEIKLDIIKEYVNVFTKGESGAGNGI